MPTITGTGGPDALTGDAGADVLLGLGGSDTLVGGQGNDSLSASDGDDRLDGGRGADTLSGGEGEDTFVILQGDTSPLTPDIITDWTSDDRLNLATGPGAYQEASAPDAGMTYANSLIAAGARFVAVQTPAGVIVYMDTAVNGGQAEDAVLLAGRTLDDISAINLGSADTLPTAPMGPAEPTNTPPTTPTTPTSPTTPTTPTSPTTPTTPTAPTTPTLPPRTATSQISLSGNMDTARLGDLAGFPVTSSSSNNFQIWLGNMGATLISMPGGLTFDTRGFLTGGPITRMDFAVNGLGGQMFVAFDGSQFMRWVNTNATQEAFTTLFAGNDNMNGGPESDLLRGYAGSDLMQGNGGDNRLFGGEGNDIIFGYAQPGTTFGTAGANYLRGDEGDDIIVGGVLFDDINGNMGDDTAAGGRGDDWVVGGKDNDRLSGEAGNDLVYGNLGNDTCDGGDGNDIVRGGQGDDTVSAGAGADFVSGDLGNDTLSGGAGADTFNTFAETGLDRVLDFNAAEGDRVQLAPGTQYTVAQVGADTVITMGGAGGQMILVGVQLSSLTPGWILGA